MACGVAKAQQQSVPKKSGGEKATKVHERVNDQVPERCQSEGNKTQLEINGTKCGLHGN